MKNKQEIREEIERLGRKVEEMSRLDDLATANMFLERINTLLWVLDDWGFRRGNLTEPREEE